MGNLRGITHEVSHPVLNIDRTVTVEHHELVSLALLRRKLCRLLHKWLDTRMNVTSVLPIKSLIDAARRNESASPCAQGFLLLVDTR